MSQDSQYEEVVSTFGAAIERLSRSYEADPDKRRDLLQDIHFALWRSFANFGRQCSLRTWVYRVAHNVGISHVLKSRRSQHSLESLEDVEDFSGPPGTADPVERRINLDHLYRLIQNLKPVDRQVILLYLEGLDASSIAEITGISAANVATKVHRIKGILSRQSKGGSRHDA